VSLLTVDKVATGWESVRAAFLEGFEKNEEHGAGVAVYHRGQCVVDLMGGWRDKDHTVPYGADALQVVFSTTKGVTSIAVAMCVERGLLDYSENVSTYWPEFADKGKGNVTVAQLLSHRAGLYTVDGDITLEEALDWDTVTGRLAVTAPRFPVDSTHGYHAITFGWLAGELVRRVSGKSIGQFVRDEIASPLNAEFHIGLPEDLEPRVARLMAHPIPKFTPEVAKLMMERSAPGTKGAEALGLNGAFGNGVFNKPEVHRAMIPGANGIGNARSLARIYAATVGEVDGVRILGEETRLRATVSNTPKGEMDQVLISETNFAMGFMVHCPRTPFSGPTSFGHDGAGGSSSFADPSRELGFSYVMNTMMTVADSDPRRERLIAAAVQSADAS
jgi:CubicO group peptidase (beta-lactamase class C family)